MRRRALTVIELLVILGILLILAAFLMPAVAKVREAASRTQSTNHLKQFGIAWHSFHDANRAGPPIAGKFNNNVGSAHFHMLPYLEADPLMQRAKGNSWNIAGEVHPLFIDPQYPAQNERLFQSAIATTNYVGSWPSFRTGEVRLPASFTDGTSNTMLSTTRYQICNDTPTAWAYPEIYTWTPMIGYYSTARFQVSPKQADCDPRLAQAYSNVIVIGLCDGSVRVAAPMINPLTWDRLIDPADGMVLEDF